MRTLLTSTMSIDPSVLMLVCVIVLVVLTTMIVILSRYRKCPSDKILVIYGKVGQTQDGQQRSAKCIHGGASFIWPVVQSYEYLDLTPMSIQVDLRNALSKQNIPRRRSFKIHRRYLNRKRRHAECGRTSSRYED